MNRLPVLVVWPPSQERERFLAAAGPEGIEVLNSPQALESRQGEGWGIMLLGPTLSPDEILRILRRERSRADPWATFLLEERDDGEWKVWPLALGPSLSLAALTKAAEAPEDAGPLPDVNWVMRALGRIAHDTNNALTAGLTEIQLLLLESAGAEQLDSLQVVERQLRRIRTLVNELSRLRSYGRSVGGS